MILSSIEKTKKQRNLISLSFPIPSSQGLIKLKISKHVFFWFNFLASSLFFLLVFVTHLSSGSDDFIDQQQLLCQNGRQVQKLLFHTVVIQNSFNFGGDRITGFNINTDGILGLLMFFNNSQKNVLGIETRIRGQSLRDDQQSVGESLNSQLDLSANFLRVFQKGFSKSDFKSSSTWENSLIFDGVLDSSQTITDGFFGLGNTVLSGALNQQSARQGVLNSLNKGVFVFTQSLLVNFSGETKVRLFEIVNRVNSNTTTSFNQSFHISSLGSSQSHDVFLGEHIQRDWVNTLLVNDNEGFVITFTNLFLQFNNLADLLISETSFSFDQLILIGSIFICENRVDFSLFVFQRDIAS
mmetsp:Transcript_10387/g.11276  ORF Transcript_10387/g.11276 Transcript_10387/m.11276 type:complete len:354 (+) Transcript_10387:228-1289(+)